MFVNLTLLGPGFVRTHVVRPSQVRKSIPPSLDVSAVSCLHRDPSGNVCGRFTKAEESPFPTGFLCPFHQSVIHQSVSKEVEEVDYIPRIGPYELDPAFKYIRVEA